MLTDPQTLTVNAVAKNLVRISENNGTSVYRLRTTTEMYVMTVRNASGKITGGISGESHVVKVEYTVFATATEPKKTMYAWLTIQNGDGVDLTQVKNVALALCAFATGTVIDKLLNGEN